MLLSAPPPWAELRIFSRAGLLPVRASTCQRLPATRSAGAPSPRGVPPASVERISRVPWQSCPTSRSHGGVTPPAAAPEPGSPCGTCWFSRTVPSSRGTGLSSTWTTLVCSAGPRPGHIRICRCGRVWVNVAETAGGCRSRGRHGGALEGRDGTFDAGGLRSAPRGIAAGWGGLPTWGGLPFLPALLAAHALITTRHMPGPPKGGHDDHFQSPAGNAGSTARGPAGCVPGIMQATSQPPRRAQPVRLCRGGVLAGSCLCVQQPRPNARDGSH